MTCDAREIDLVGICAGVEVGMCEEVVGVQAIAHSKTILVRCSDVLEGTIYWSQY